MINEVNIAAGYPVIEIGCTPRADQLAGVARIGRLQDDQPDGTSGPLAGKLILFDWLYGFFAVVGPGFFALLLYCGALAFTWGRPDAITPAHPVGRNDPCPYGSGLKAKRCCAG